VADVTAVTGIRQKTGEKFGCVLYIGLSKYITTEFQTRGVQYTLEALTLF